MGDREQKKRGRPHGERAPLGTIGLRVDAADLERARAMSAKIDRPVGWIIRQAIREYLDRHKND